MREDLILAVSFTLLARRLGQLLELAANERHALVRQAILEDARFLKHQLKRLL
jgi:urease gamma subunit